MITPLVAATILGPFVLRLVTPTPFNGLVLSVADPNQYQAPQVASLWSVVVHVVPATLLPPVVVSSTVAENVMLADPLTLVALSTTPVTSGPSLSKRNAIDRNGPHTPPASSPRT